MSKRKKRENADLKEALDHIVYELKMLRVLSQTLVIGLFGNSIFTYSMIESFAIHARNLIDFLWPQKPSNDHIIANDFFNNPDKWNEIRIEIPTILKKVRIRAHKEIAHISYDRLRVKREERNWNFALITKKISENMNIFLNSKEL
ncbi:MAG: hypothetical protein H6627_13085 [Calditrichae bacterium]|nr:hypothetical protein [Calditrichota bacterium]MCB9059499.1 hypothetical protein [Calditrichia bacterium]